MAVPPAEEAPVVLAALGPKMLELAAERTKGAHPYWTTPEHTAMAREIMGPDAWLCVEQSVFSPPTPTSPTPPPTISSACTPTFRTTATTGSGSVSPMTKSATAPRFLDAVMAWGDEAAIADRIQAHYDAGASHVCIQPIDPETRGSPTGVFSSPLPHHLGADEPVSSNPPASTPPTSPTGWPSASPTSPGPSTSN